MLLMKDEERIRTETNRYTCLVVHHNRVETPRLVPGKAMLRKLGMLGMLWRTKAREDDRNTTADGFRSIKSSLGGYEEVFSSTRNDASGRFPRDDGGPIVEDLDGRTLVKIGAEIRSKGY